MVDREGELERLQGFLAETLAGRGNLVLISGEAGIGKTRLVEELESLAEMVGCRMALGRCVPGTSGPYLPFVEAFRDSFGIDILGGGEGGRGRGELSLFSALDQIKRLEADGPLVFRMEDFQWADPASVQMLHFLARDSEPLRVLYIVTYRPEELNAEASSSIHPFLESMRIMKREGVCSEICLGQLAEGDIKELVEGLLGDRVESGLMECIVTESCGNPLFAVEMVRTLVTSELIIEGDGEWRVAEPEHFAIPTTITQVMLNRIERMTTRERSVLEVAAVIGESFDPDTIQSTLGINLLELLEILDHLEKDLRLVRSDKDSYRFANKKVHMVIYEEMPNYRRRELDRLVRGPAGCGGGGGDPAREVRG